MMNETILNFAGTLQGGRLKPWMQLSKEICLRCHSFYMGRSQGRSISDFNSFPQALRSHAVLKELKCSMSPNKVSSQVTMAARACPPACKSITSDFNLSSEEMFPLFLKNLNLTNY